MAMYHVIRWVKSLLGTVTDAFDLDARVALPRRDYIMMRPITLGDIMSVVHCRIYNAERALALASLKAGMTTLTLPPVSGDRGRSRPGNDSHRRESVRA